MKDRPGGGRASVLSSSGLRAKVGVEPGAVAGRVGVGTLLGPEGSGSLVSAGWWVGGGVSLRASLGAGAP